ncbi:hypothetical protein [Roseburia inulinivorans]|uniref:hypothetical protein n=1 Tax=Roseburia inulinivorans TaxID=360807 RepID=UPI001D14401A|nr:hypothetical protein [Roseburia inulinivorans]MCC3343989.1 hypothetical protein [Roseburia inulinivorans DSM 16841]
MTVDLQDTYMQNAKILLVSGENIEDFHVTGQCESLNMLQGNKFAVAELENPWNGRLQWTILWKTEEMSIFI